jgi:hypothetical protein
MVVALRQARGSPVRARVGGMTGEDRRKMKTRRRKDQDLRDRPIEGVASVHELARAMGV